MLKQRILTAVILGPLILWSVVVFSHRALAIEIGLILAIAAWEWARLSGVNYQPARVAYSVFMALAMLALTLLMHTHSEFLQTILWIVALWWLIALIIIVVENKHPQKHETITTNQLVVNLLTGMVILSGAYVAIVGLHQAPQYGYVFILILLAFIWLADSAAYFSGKAFGKHKLAVNVSPGKTWEGVMGALVATVVAAFIISYVMQYNASKSALFVLIAVITVCISIVGDLLESLFKRRVGVKDSSQLLPGHGGILDRIDSLVAAAPVFLLGLMAAGI
jgi:phosphatidate cytidylyltransferase